MFFRQALKDQAKKEKKSEKPKDKEKGPRTDDARGGTGGLTFPQTRGEGGGGGKPRGEEKKKDVAKTIIDTSIRKQKRTPTASEFNLREKGGEGGT